MKKLLAIVLIIAMLIPAACAEMGFSDLITLDLSNLTLEQLILLREKIELTMWGTDDWQAVVVPQGVYQIGVDIPAGKWTISATEGNKCGISIGNSLKPKGDVAFTGDLSTYESVKSKGWYSYTENVDLTSMDFELAEGYYIQIDYGSAIFTPYAGKPALGFKFK